MSPLPTGATAAQPVPATHDPRTAAAGGNPAVLVPDEGVPFLPRGVRVRFCEVRQTHFLLAPERAVKLASTAGHILAACDGTRDFRAVVAHLAEAFDAPPDRIAADARPFLADLVAKRMVEIRR